MKVILLQDVAKIGRRFDIVEVPSGYGMNKLIPQGMAKPATPENVKAVQAQAASNEAAKAQADEAFTELVSKAKEADISITVDANEEGRLFQAIKPEVIAETIAQQTGQEVPLEQIVIKSPIKELGEHTIELVSGDTVVTLTITVQPK